jgi:hypothetical protein
MDEEGGRLRPHGRHGICLACIKVDTQLGHRCISISPGTESRPCCLLPDTLIYHADGSKRRVVDLQAGDKVLAFQRESGTFIGTEVTLIWNDHPREGYFLVNEEIGITGDHPVLTINANRVEAWTQVSKLSIGNHVVSSTGPIKIESLQYIAGDVTTVYVETELGNFLAGPRAFVVSGNYVEDAVIYNLLKSNALQPVSLAV